MRHKVSFMSFFCLDKKILIIYKFYEASLKQNVAYICLKIIKDFTYHFTIKFQTSSPVYIVVRFSK